MVGHHLQIVSQLGLELGPFLPISASALCRLKLRLFDTKLCADALVQLVSEPAQLREQPRDLLL